MFFVLILRILLLGNVSAVLWENVAGSYGITLKGISKCSNEGKRTFYLENTKVKRVNRNKIFVNTSIIVTKPMDNTNLDLDIASYNNGMWRDHFFINLGGLCTRARQMLPKFLNNVFSYMPSRSCPFPVGNTTVKNLDMILDYNLPYLIPGTYKADVIMTQKESRIGCLQLLIDIAPTKTKKH